jgi:hypothetical protein
LDAHGWDVLRVIAAGEGGGQCMCCAPLPLARMILVHLDVHETLAALLAESNLKLNWRNSFNYIW